MRTLDDTGRLLDLLREAGDEAVTLDELAIVGVRDPARALLELELGGHAVQRVHDLRPHGRVTCVRLGGTADAPPSPTPDRRPVVVAALIALLVVVVAARR